MANEENNGHETVGRYDPPVGRFQPDRELVARAQQHMMALEDELHPAMRPVRHQWEAAFGATRVAIDTLREIWPVDRAVMPPRSTHEIKAALKHLEQAFEHLDNLAEEMLGDVFHSVLTGRITEHAQLDELEVGQYDAARD